MNTRPILLTSLFFLLLSQLSLAQPKGDDATYSFDGITYHLNGQGMREKWLFDLYVGKLYLLEKSTNAGSIIHANQPMLIELDIVSNKITSEKMKSAIKEGFSHSVNPKPDTISHQINAFTAAFKAPIKKGDYFSFIYQPKKGTRVYKNGKLLVTIAGLPFKQALFNIWLGKKPADQSLKQDMLGI